MKLRLILLILSLMAIIFATVGGYLYYASYKETAFREAERETIIRLERISKDLTQLLSEYNKPVRILAGMAELKELLRHPGPVTLAAANSILDHFKNTLQADVCYLMDNRGRTVASSNRNDPDSFVGQNFAFRPYFQRAIRGQSASYLALGTTSGKRGVYFSYPIYSYGRESPDGIVVIKGSIEMIEREAGFNTDEIVLVTDPNGVIFIANRPEWLYRTAWRISPETAASIAASRQFGPGPWSWAGLQNEAGEYVVDRNGVRYLHHQIDLDDFPGWRIHHLLNMQTITQAAFKPLVVFVRPLSLALFVVMCLSVFVLYRQASLEIRQRKAAEEALRESDARYRSLYYNTPAMLHSINRNGEIVSISNYWSEVLGYTEQEVIGRKLTDFFTTESKNYAEQEIFPEFFKKGYCVDVPYQIVKKDGQILDILLSAIGERDERGEIFRTLAVSIDVTERNRAVEALRHAKEELASYSRDLEKQVSIRTREMRRLSGRIMVSQEKERTAIARELHDELGQVLTALRMDAVWLQERVKDSDARIARRAMTMCELIDKTIKDVRSIAIRLRPGVLDDLGLVDALEWLTTDFENRSSINCVFEHGIVPELNETVATAAYRICQEALTNVARHAGAGRVSVVLKFEKKILSLSIRDDGRGFEVEKLAEFEGVGIAGMRERALLAGGSLEVMSEKDKGCHIRFTVPV